MKTLIVIPARYGSTRLPGKPLQLILGQTMLSRVYNIAKDVAETVVATDDERIAHHCHEIGAPFVMTDSKCPSGTDRVYAACKEMELKPDFVINLQGDAPLTPSSSLHDLIALKKRRRTAEVVTPVIQLSWDELEMLRSNKLTTPFSGTTAVVVNEKALWFSKNILPSIRDEVLLKTGSALSPVFQHIGLYGYSYDALEQFVNYPQSHYEKLEGLEQLRFLENGHAIDVLITQGAHLSTGVDSPEDVKRVEDFLRNTSYNLGS